VRKTRTPSKSKSSEEAQEANKTRKTAGAGGKGLDGDTCGTNRLKKRERGVRSKVCLKKDKKVGEQELE